MRAGGHWRRILKLIDRFVGARNINRKSAAVGICTRRRRIIYCYVGRTRGAPAVGEWAVVSNLNKRVQRENEFGTGNILSLFPFRWKRPELYSRFLFCKKLNLQFLSRP